LRFQKLALLLFGNVKFAFKRFRLHPTELEDCLVEIEPRGVETFCARHLPIHPIEPITPQDTYLLGYLIEGKIRDRLHASPQDHEALALEAKRIAAVERGKRNQSAYLVSDHLDVYVATSMREPHEYLAVNELCRVIFEHPSLAPLKLRWFDPTQAYCQDRIDKGLAEALMLKRANTVYLVQESDTLGKDSELASTLAQPRETGWSAPLRACSQPSHGRGSIMRFAPDQRSRGRLEEEAGTTGGWHARRDRF
jgi:hypothetical protein